MSDASSDSSGSDPRQEAERLYVEYLGSDEASLTDGFERLAQRHPRLEDALRSLHAEFENLERVLDEAAASPEFPFEELSRLHARGGHKRYRIEGEIARGGQGAVMRIWDSDLKRHLAMKLTLGRVTSSTAGDADAPTPASSTPPLDSRTIHRFLSEAKITGQLDHPGIVPIHELGVDDDGQAYFTMKLVNGHSLHEIFQRHRQGDPEWTTQRCVGLILKATEAVAYAHSKGIIHRDLKPANIMVGEYGEVYVMDWGMARELCTRESGKRERTVSTDDSDPEFLPSTSQGTVTGAVLGTPSYMSPEQAWGANAEVDERSDVYSLGAVLYELLKGAAPYREPGSDRDPIQIVEAIRAGPPEPLSSREGEVPGELAAVATQALSWKPIERYQAAGELLDDLRAYAEGRIVRAHDTRLVTAVRKWVSRNRALSGAILVAVLVALIGAVAVYLSEVKRANIAQEAEEIARVEADYLLSAALIGAIEDPRGLGARHAQAWREWHLGLKSLLERWGSGQFASGDPLGEVLVEPVSVGGDLRELDGIRLQSAQVRKYLADADEFLSGRKGEPIVEEALSFKLEAQRLLLSQLEQRLRAVEPRLVPGALPESVRDKAATILNHLEYLKDDGAGHLRYAASALELSEIAASSKAEDWVLAWGEASRSIADQVECPLYGGLQVFAHPELVPLRRNPETSLWEFWMPTSGERPALGPRGEFIVTGETGLVFVLLPGGEGKLGSQRDDPAAARFDPLTKSQDEPVATIGMLEPFFLSKYELTQGQWWRMARAQPSAYNSGLQSSGYPRIMPSHPVETVSQSEARRVLARNGLSLPTETQWEWGARAAGELRFGVTANEVVVSQQENCGQRLEFVLMPNGRLVWIEAPRAHLYHAPVGSFEPNAFGLHDCLGNVSEWCSDTFAASVELLNPGQVEPGTLRISARGSTAVVYRGGNYLSRPAGLRASARMRASADSANELIGLRPAMSLSM